MVRRADKQTRGGQNSVQVLVFDLSGNRVALPVQQVARIMHAVAPVNVPGAPSLLEGLINFQGQPVPVLDIRKRLGVPRVPIRASHFLILVQRKQRLCALRVDDIEGIFPVDAGIGEPLRGSLHAPCLAGVAALEQRLLLIYDVELFLSQAEAEEIESYLASLPGTLDRQ